MDEVKKVNTKSSTSKKNGSLHANHRKRIDEKIRRNGFEFLPDHEQLEFLLFVAIPMGDTNELAHRLLERFGTMKGVLNAGYKKLKEVKGVGVRTAMYLSQLNSVAGVIVRSQDDKPVVLDTNEKIGNYIRTYYLGRLKEASYIFFLDGRSRLIGAEKLSDGTIDETYVYPREVLKVTLESSASAVILAHNHPTGLVEPSSQDIAVNKRIESSLRHIGVRLEDNIIVSGNNYYSFRENGYLSTLKWI